MSCFGNSSLMFPRPHSKGRPVIQGNLMTMWKEERDVSIADGRTKKLGYSLASNLDLEDRVSFPHEASHEAVI